MKPVKLLKKILSSEFAKTLSLSLSVTTILLIAKMSFTASAAATSGIFPLAGTKNYGNVPAPVAGKAEDMFTNLVWDLVLNARYILAAVAIAMIVLAGFRMVLGWGNDDVYASQRKVLLYSIIGLALVGMAGEIAKIFQVGCSNYVPAGATKIPCQPGGFLSNPNAIIRTTTLFNQRTQLIITAIKYIIGAIAVIMLGRNALRMVTMGSDESEVALDKKNIVYTLVGLFMIIISDTVISKVFYKLDITRYPTAGGVKAGIDTAQGLKEIAGFTDFIVTLVGPITLGVLVVGGIMYITAAGKEDQMEKAKRMMVTALVGIIVIYGAFAIVSTFVSGSFGNPEDAVATQTQNSPDILLEPPK